MTERQPASRLEALLRARQFAITAEITPPVSCEADDLLHKALPLARLADAVNVTDGAGAADVPVDPPPAWRPDKLAAKVAAGAEFAQTQFCMDTGVVRRYAARLLEHAQTRGVFLLIGIAPLRSARSARWMRERLYGTIIPDVFIERLERAPQPGAEGERIAIQLIEELAAIPGVAGLHLLAPANEEALPRVITEARKRLPRH